MARTADYHCAGVNRSLAAEGGTRAWFASCTACGWRGAQRPSPAAAFADAAAHDDAENGHRGAAA